MWKVTYTMTDYIYQFSPDARNRNILVSQSELAVKPYTGAGKRGKTRELFHRRLRLVAVLHMIDPLNKQTFCSYAQIHKHFEPITKLSKT